MRNEFTAIVEQDGPWFIAYCAEVPGANGQGRTRKIVWRISSRRSHWLWNTGAKTPCVRYQSGSSSAGAHGYI